MEFRWFGSLVQDRKGEKKVPRPRRGAPQISPDTPLLTPEQSRGNILPLVSQSQIPSSSQFSEPRHDPLFCRPHVGRVTALALLLKPSTITTRFFFPFQPPPRSRYPCSRSGQVRSDQSPGQTNRESLHNTVQYPFVYLNRTVNPCSPHPSQSGLYYYCISVDPCRCLASRQPCLVSHQHPSHHPPPSFFVSRPIHSSHLSHPPASAPASYLSFLLDRASCQKPIGNLPHPPRFASTLKLRHTWVRADLE